MRMKLNQKQIQKNNSGFSIIELLVVVAIMAVFIGGALTTFLSVSRTNVKKSNSVINDAMIFCKGKAMTNAAKEWKLVLSEHEANVVKVSSDGKVSTIKSYALPNKVDIFVNTSEESYAGKIGDDGDYESVSIVYSSKGSITKVYDENNNSLMDKFGNTCCIVSKYKQSKSASIKLYFITGKHAKQ